MKIIEFKNTTLFGLLLFVLVLGFSIFMLNEYDKSAKADLLFEIIEKLKDTKAIKQIEIDLNKYQNKEINQDETAMRFRKSMDLLGKEVKGIYHYSMDIFFQVAGQDFKIFPKNKRHNVEFLTLSEKTESVINKLNAPNSDIYKVNLENNNQYERFKKKIIYPIIINENYKAYIRLGYYVPD